MTLHKNVNSKCKIKRIVVNESRQQSPFPEFEDNLNSQNMSAAMTAISKWPAYTKTPLVSLENVADHCGVERVLYKDESKRFGLKSFKALGGAYAVFNLVSQQSKKGVRPSELTVTTATDGNHGRSVAWGAQLSGCNAEIYIHEKVSQQRADAMAFYGAKINRVKGNYEASLAACKKDAIAKQRFIVSDTSWEGYRKEPLDIMAGYTVMGQEILESMGETRPTHCFLPIGVGGLAAGVVAPIWRDMGKNLGSMIGVESYMSDCFLQSINSGAPQLVDVKEETMMAGLSCGEISDLAWEVLKPSLSHCVSITDDAIAPLMFAFANGNFSEEKIEAGECATSGLNALLAAKEDKKIWHSLGIKSDSVVLLLGTEGATDPYIYSEMLDQGRL